MDRPEPEQSAPSALEELAADPSSRKRFLRMAGGGAVAAALAGLVAACGDDEEAGDTFGGAGAGTREFGQGDAGIVGYALFLEALEVNFYDQAIKSGKLRGRGLELANRFHDEEVAHTLTLARTLETLGGKPPGKEKTNFKFPLDNEGTILNTAARVEHLGAAAYLGQVRRIRDKQILAAALSIHAVEARHAAALALLLKKPITPDGPFANPAPSLDVLRQVRPFIAR
jgi:rubrerythrin